MPRYLIERRFPESFDSFLLERPTDLIIAANNETGVTWSHNYVTDDSRRVYCLYEAPNPRNYTQNHPAGHGLRVRRNRLPEARPHAGRCRDDPIRGRVGPLGGRTLAGLTPTHQTARGLGGKGAADVSRLIEVQPVAQDVPEDLTVGVGDVLRFAASGGRVRDGTAVEILGIFVESVLGTDGQVVAPMGPPNAVLFRARQPGRAAIDVVTGDPWHSPVTRSMTIVVEP